MRSLFPVCLLALVPAACRAVPPRVDSSLVTSTELLTANPADIAILPIADAALEEPLGDELQEHLRREIARALTRRRYTPLRPEHVDDVLARDSIAARGRSVVDAAWLAGIKGKFGEDAVLGIRLTRWDDSSIMADALLGFAVEVSMIDSRSGEILWSGEIEGHVKAGGERPAPLGRRARVRDAAAQLGHELARRLPKRRP